MEKNSKYNKINLEEKVNYNINKILNKKTIIIIITVLLILVFPYILYMGRAISENLNKSDENLIEDTSNNINEEKELIAQMEEKYRPLINNNSLKKLKSDNIDYLYYDVYASENEEEIIYNFKNEINNEDFILSYHADDFDDNYLFINKKDSLSYEIIDIFNKQQIKIEDYPTGNIYTLTKLKNPIDVRRQSFEGNILIALNESKIKKDIIKFSNEELESIYSIFNNKYKEFINKQIFTIKEEVDFQISSNLGNSIKTLITTNGNNLIFNIIVNPKRDNMFFNKSNPRESFSYLFGYEINGTYSKDRIDTYLDKKDMDFVIEDKISKNIIKVNIITGYIKLEKY